MEPLQLDKDKWREIALDSHCLCKPAVRPHVPFPTQFVLSFLWTLSPTPGMLPSPCPHPEAFHSLEFTEAIHFHAFWCWMCCIQNCVASPHLMSLAIRANVNSISSTTLQMDIMNFHQLLVYSLTIYFQRAQLCCGWSWGSRDEWVQFFSKHWEISLKYIIIKAQQKGIRDLIKSQEVMSPETKQRIASAWVAMRASRKRHLPLLETLKYLMTRCRIGSVVSKYTRPSSLGKREMRESHCLAVSELQVKAELLQVNRKTIISCKICR